MSVERRSGRDRCRRRRVPAESGRAQGVGQFGRVGARGRVERDADGSPSGTLHEGAMRFVGDLVPPARPDVVARGLVEGQAYLHALGITAWQDALVEGGPADRTGPFEVCVGPAQVGPVTARVVAALWCDRTAGLDQ